jgi:hypothetical protein
VADGTENDIGGLAVATPSIFMCPIIGSMAERQRSSRLMTPKDAALLAGDEDTTRIGGVVDAIALVDMARSIAQPVSF